MLKLSKSMMIKVLDKALDEIALDDVYDVYNRYKETSDERVEALALVQMQARIEEAFGPHTIEVAVSKAGQLWVTGYFDGENTDETRFFSGPV